MSLFPRTARALDEVQRPEQLERFDPDQLVATASAEQRAPGTTLAELGEQLDALRGLLDEIERFTEKSVRIGLQRSADGLPAKLRTLVHSTVISYADNLPLLRSRIGAALARVNVPGAEDLVERVVELAERALAVRASLRQGVLALAQRVAADWRTVAERGARDRSQPDEPLLAWRRARMDLEQLAGNGRVLEAGSFRERLERITSPEDPPEEEKPDRFSLLELD
jgi:hypothetical protein